MPNKKKSWQLPITVEWDFLHAVFLLTFVFFVSFSDVWAWFSKVLWENPHGNVM